jgi:endonuclease/exonuclease/phosphatase family metal-dependent hydrolase
MDRGLVFLLAMKSKRLVSYNIHKGFDPFGRSIGIEPMKKALIESGADFLLVQELVGERFKGNQIEKQLELLADQRWPHQAYGKNAVYSSGHHGNAILSSVPIRKFQNMDLTIQPLEMRGLLHVELEVELRPLHLITAHLDLFDITRSKQIEKILEILGGIPKNEAILFGGDFNDWAKKIGPIFSEHLGLQEFLSPSFPAPFPLFCLDRIYARRIAVENFRVFHGKPWNFLSDHLPLALDFRWNF